MICRSTMFMVFIACHCNVVSASTDDCDLGEPNLSARVKHVYDGDTVKIERGDTIRILGMNTPEIASKYRAGEKGAIQAKQFLEKILKQSKNQVTVYFDNQIVDRYGRILAYIKTEKGIDVSKEMIKQGYAAAVAVRPNVSLANCYQRIELSARKKSLNNWAIVENWHITDDNAAEFKGGFGIFATRIIEYAKKGKYYHFILANGYTMKVKSALATQIINMIGKKVLVRNWYSKKIVSKKIFTLYDRRMILNY